MNCVADQATQCKVMHVPLMSRGVSASFSSSMPQSRRVGEPSRRVVRACARHVESAKSQVVSAVMDELAKEKERRLVSALLASFATKLFSNPRPTKQEIWR